MAELSQQHRTQVGALDIGIMLFTLISAIIHIYLWTFPDEPLRVWFLLNGIGYIVLLVALYLPRLYAFRRLLCYALIGYTALTFILYFFLGQPYDSLGLTTKAVEVLLMVMLVVKSISLSSARRSSY